jgi:hypothetical protein
VGEPSHDSSLIIVQNGSCCTSFVIDHHCGWTKADTKSGRFFLKFELALSQRFLIASSFRMAAPHALLHGNFETLVVY